MAEIIIWDIPSIFLSGIAFSILCIGGFLYLNKGVKSESFNEKIIIFGYAAIFLSFACLVFFFALASSYMAGIYMNFAFFTDSSQINALSDIFYRVTYSSLFFGFLFFILLFEINFKRTKYILSIIGFLINITTLLIAPINSEINLLPYAYNLLMAVLVIIIFTNWSKFEYRIISSYIMMGLVCIGWAGAFLGIPFLYGRNLLPMWISSLLICIGGIIMIITLFITPTNLSRSWFYGQFFCQFFIISLQIIFMLVFIFGGLPIIATILIIVSTFLYIYMLFSNIKSIKTYQAGTISSQEKELHPDILSMFVRPQKLTEEEVSVAKEKKICLVYKNKVTRFNIFICPECDTLYCENCAKALSDLENTCWVCGVSLDPSKPSKTVHEMADNLEFIVSNDTQKFKKLPK